MLFDKKCPSNVIFIFNDMHNGNMKLEHFIDIGKSVPKNYLVERLNAVNKQGITDIDLNTRTYKKGSITLPIYKLSTGESFPCSGHSHIPRRRYIYILW